MSLREPAPHLFTSRPSAIVLLALLALALGGGCTDRTAGGGLGPSVPEAQPCGDGCPDGTTCAPIIAEDGTPTFACVDVHLRYCAPCLEDSDCIDPYMPDAGSVCTSWADGSGSFCATDCSTHNDCPEGAYCETREDGRAVCMPESGECSCSEWAIQNEALTSCSTTNMIGTCQGVRSCTEDGLTACDAPAPSEEICNGIDDDCNGETDEVYPEAGAICDGGDDDLCNDGVFVCEAGVLFCAENPDGRTEICNGEDDDCDGLVDDDLPLTLGSLQEGVCADSVQTCGGTSGWIEPDYTLIDGYEFDEQTCDDLDNDCDGGVDELYGQSGVVTFTDLDGTEGLVKGDSCGVGACGQGRVVCGDDGTSLTCDTHVEAITEVCDGLDNDCNGNIDDVAEAPLAANQVGVCSGVRQVCDGTGGWVEPDYTVVLNYEEVELTCDGLDNDCDGQVDEGLESPVASMQSGVCAGSVQVCQGTDGWQDPDFTQIIGFEAGETTCDGLDNDCDGEVDDNLVVPSSLLQSGVCLGQVQICAGSDGWVEPNYGAIAGYELDELTCDGLDNDCNGVIDDGLTAPAATLQLGVCAGSSKVCGGATGWVEPDLLAIEGYEVDETLCDDLDNDCDGTTDESYLSGGVVNLVDVGGATRTKGESCGVGACTGGSVICGSDAVSLVCSTAGLAQGETCDGTDNDCDGATDESLSPPLNPNQQGLCSGSYQSCLGVAGWGEDYSSVPGYGMTEDPDDQFLDDNCDGIDGDILAAVFVSTLGSDDGLCALEAPCQSINHAIATAVSRGLTDVYVQSGDYFETVVLADGIDVFGGYDSSWIRDDRALDGHGVQLVGTGDVQGEFVAVSASGVSAGLHGLSVRAPDAVGTQNTTGRSSYALHAVGSALTLSRVTVYQGQGADGLNGANGVDANQSRAADGSGGGNGEEFNSICDSSTRGSGGGGAGGTCANTAGGSGGSGGRMDTNCSPWPWILDWSAQGGDAGGSATLVAASFGYGGSGGGTCSGGSNGASGLVSNGAGGFGASGGSLVGNYWYAFVGGNGGLGAHGGGGGGGGGSGGCDDGTDSTGAGGGGGGAGGCRAEVAAYGGGGGGGSFGAFLVDGSLSVRDSVFVLGSGGHGGRGGNGGSGQPGGYGGNGGTGNGTGNGGVGGRGGHGGHGGGGGGGAGGDAFGIFGYNASVSQVGIVTFEGGSAGIGGAGGASALTASADAQDGNVGQSGASGTLGEVGEGS